MNDFTASVITQVLRRQAQEADPAAQEPAEEDKCGIQEIDRLGFRVSA